MNLQRIRWGVRSVLALGVAASIAGNILHAQPNVVSRVISAWSPLALLLTIELIARVPVHSRGLAFARWAATALIAGIAAWVSYWHMAAVAARYGETGASPYLLPLSVDGLVVVASVCLVELGGRIRSAGRTPTAAGRRSSAQTPVEVTNASNGSKAGPAPSAEGSASAGAPRNRGGRARQARQPVAKGRTPSDDEALTRLRARLNGQTPSIDNVQKILGCGRSRAIRLRDLLGEQTPADEPDPRPVRLAYDADRAAV